VGVLGPAELGEGAPGGGEVAVAKAGLDGAHGGPRALHRLREGVAQGLGVGIQPTGDDFGAALRRKRGPHLSPAYNFAAAAGRVGPGSGRAVGVHGVCYAGEAHYDRHQHARQGLSKVRNRTRIALI
jgi:hypothetical protein